MTSTAAVTLRRLMNQSVSVETLSGVGPFGDEYTDPVSVGCYIEESTKLVRNARGEEIVSTTTLYADFDDAGAFTENTRVTVNGRTTTVVANKPWTAGSAGLPDHVEVYLS